MRSAGATGKCSFTDIAVLGAGPAGVAAACGLRKLGYSVVLLGDSANTSVEGLSPRAHSLLRALDLHAAANCAGSPGKRSGIWGDMAVAVNREYVVDRVKFDRALRIDATASGVDVYPGLVTAVEPREEFWRVRTQSVDIECRAVVDGRGRRIGRALQRGPSLISVSQRLDVPAGAPRTSIHPLSTGWCWFASDGSGRGALQLVAASPGFCTRSELSQRVLECLPQIATAVPESIRAVPAGEPQARAATARMLAPAYLPGYVRVGDAAVASDPLSGHGLYEALRSAQIAVAASHTYVGQAKWEPVSQFLNEAAQDLWDSSIDLAAGFYRRQAACTPTAFWMETAGAYESMGARRSSVQDKPAVTASRIESRPVLNGSLIEIRPVVVTRQRPRGVWQLDAVELASLVELFRSEPAPSLERAAEQLAREPGAITNAVRWLAAHGLIHQPEPPAASYR